ARGPAVAGASAVVGPGGCFEGSISRRGMSRSCQVVTDNRGMNADVEHPSDEDRCLCGSGDIFGACCGPLLRGQRRAGTAEALASWHPDTRPRRSALAATLDEEMRWLRLDVRSTTDGGPFDDEGTVEFVATARTEQGRRELHEISHFVREDGTWRYVSGELGAAHGRQ